MPAAILFAALSGCLAVALGAWAAHGLDGRLPAQAMGWLRTGLDYQTWHAAALLAVAALARGGPAPAALRLAALGLAITAPTALRSALAVASESSYSAAAMSA